MREGAQGFSLLSGELANDGRVFFGWCDKGMQMFLLGCSRLRCHYAVSVSDRLFSCLLLLSQDCWGPRAKTHSGSSHLSSPLLQNLGRISRSRVRRGRRQKKKKKEKLLWRSLTIPRCGSLSTRRRSELNSGVSQTEMKISDFFLFAAAI